jgi:hypothetical protein
VLSHIAAKVTDEFPFHMKLRLALPGESHPELSRFSGDDLGIATSRLCAQPFAEAGTGGESGVSRSVALPLSNDKTRSKRFDPPLPFLDH